MHSQKNSDVRQNRTGPLITAAIVLGIGIAGVMEGILFNQLLQWHQLLSAKIPLDTMDGKSLNNFWNGVFHSFSWLVTLVGIFLLWSLIGRNDVSRSNRVFFGGVGWGVGIFILVEGIANHYLLSLHHVNEGSVYRNWWDLAFLLLGALFTFGGWYTTVQKSIKTDKQPVRHVRRIYPVQYIKSKTR
ncbi:MAG TPA: DUF2243 domain-containing protein [Flavitalea sp.]|nr:DUF2243 domain-containing protein [Flavitalea sp.]